MKRIILFLAVILTLASCDGYGKKLKINDSLEVYYKGDGVTEADARKLGDYMAELWKDASNEKSLQLSKNKDAYVVKMVVDEKMVKDNPAFEESFKAVKALLERDVFQGNKVTFTITDNTFDDIKSF